MIPDNDPVTEESWLALPTETEIYILPNGEIIVADLPAELAAQIAQLTPIQNLQDHPKPSDDDQPDFAHPT